MPCALTKGFTLDCKDGVGGIVEVKIKAYSPADLANITPQTDGSVTIATAAQTGWYRYELNKETGTLEEKLTANPETRSYGYEQTLKFPLYNLSRDKQTELQLVAKNRLWIAVKTSGGTCWLLGYDLGADLTESVGSTGKSFTDKNGYDITFVSKQKVQMLDCTTAYANLTQ